MSTREALIQELMKQPEQVLQKLRRYLDSIEEHQNGNGAAKPSVWPDRYFEATAGAFANEPFERPPQLPFEKREEW
jgi:hypothetical protein